MVAFWSFWQREFYFQFVPSASKVGIEDLFQPLLWALFLIGSLAGFAVATYPALPRYLGGGKTDPVYLVPASSFPVEVSRRLPRSRRHAGLVGPVLVILETD